MYKFEKSENKKLLNIIKKYVSIYNKKNERIFANNKNCWFYVYTVNIIHSFKFLAVT